MGHSFHNHWPHHSAHHSTQQPERRSLVALWHNYGIKMEAYIVCVHLNYLFVFYLPSQDIKELSQKHLQTAELSASKLKNIQEIEKLSKKHLETAEFSASKLSNIELRLDMAHGKPWDILRHLQQHLAEFSPNAGGSQLFLQFLNTQKWSFLSGVSSQMKGSVSLSKIFFQIVSMKQIIN